MRDASSSSLPATQRRRDRAVAALAVLRREAHEPARRREEYGRERSFVDAWRARLAGDGRASSRALPAPSPTVEATGGRRASRDAGVRAGCAARWQMWSSRRVPDIDPLALALPDADRPRITDATVSSSELDPRGPATRTSRFGESRATGNVRPCTRSAGVATISTPLRRLDRAERSMAPCPIRIEIEHFDGTERHRSQPRRLLSVDEARRKPLLDDLDADATNSRVQPMATPHEQRL